MIRNLKALGFALAALFALSAVAASTAPAQQGTITSTGPFIVTGTETGAAGSNAWTLFGLKTECPGSTYSGGLNNTTPHQGLPSGSTTVTITPHYNDEPHGCIVTPGNFRATTDMNGCDYLAHVGVTTGGVAGTYGGTIDIVCPVGQEITKTLATNTTDLTAGKLMCIQHIPPQVGLTGVHITQTASGHLGLTGPIKGIKITETASATHRILCPKKETTAAEIDIDVTVAGETPFGVATALTLSHP